MKLGASFPLCKLVVNINYYVWGGVPVLTVTIQLLDPDRRIL